MKKIILEKDESSLFNLLLVNNDDLMGRLTIYPYKDKIGWLDLYIEEKYRCRWLTKSFAKFIYQTHSLMCKENNLNYVFTGLKNPKSLRLLDFFGFTKYNEKYYYLTIY